VPCATSTPATTHTPNILRAQLRLITQEAPELNSAIKTFKDHIRSIEFACSQ
jgi:hypothetical protein